MSQAEAKKDCWIEIEEESDFPIENLPWGVFRQTIGDSPVAQIGVAIGKQILCLKVLVENGVFSDFDQDVVESLKEVTVGSICK